jgi:hypothetical protein
MSATENFACGLRRPLSVPWCSSFVSDCGQILHFQSALFKFHESFIKVL